MGKLIDADVLLKEIKGIDFAAEAKTMNVTYDNEMSGFFQGYMEGAIYFTPTAYDIDKVVDRLEIRATYWYNKISEDGAGAVIAYQAFKEAIEIVKSGGKA